MINGELKHGKKTVVDLLKSLLDVLKYNSC